MLHPDAACARIGPARDIAGSKNSGDVRLQKFVHQHAVVRCDPCFFSKRGVWAHANSYDHQVAFQNGFIIELHVSIFYHCGRSTEMKFHAVRLVSFAN